MVGFREKQVSLRYLFIIIYLIPGIIGISSLLVISMISLAVSALIPPRIAPFLVTIDADPSQGCRIKQGPATHMRPWCIFRSWEGLNQPLRSLGRGPLEKERKGTIITL